MHISKFKHLLGDSHSNIVLLYDPSYSSRNLGDEVISKSALSYLDPVLKWRSVVHLSSHQSTSFRFRRHINSNGIGFVLGSNLLQSKKLFGQRNWEVSLADTLQIGNLVLVGCGWSTYSSRKADPYTKLFYKRILSSEFLQSVRDEYTKNQLDKLGVQNVVNTGCPTLWCLTEEHCSQIRREKGVIAVTTITDYNKDLHRDSEMLSTLLSQYSQVYLWPQGSRDYEYLNQLGLLGSVRLIEPSLDAYDTFLLNHPEADYVGTRLHGGVRALQHKNRSLIVSIDNRAREMGRDYKLPLIERDDMGDLGVRVNETFATEVKINEAAIERFLREIDAISAVLPKMNPGESD